MNILKRLFKPKRTPSPDVQTDTAECERIINQYGAVLQKTAHLTFGAPESMLPYNKEQIKSAIKVALVLADETSKEQLRIGYVELARFIPDVEATRAAAGNEALLSGDTEHPNWKYVEETQRIGARIAEEQKRLLAEVYGF